MQPKQEFESDLADKNEIHLKRPLPSPPIKTAQNTIIYYWLSEQVSAFIGLSQLILSTLGKTLFLLLLTLSAQSQRVFRVQGGVELLLFGVI